MLFSKNVKMGFVATLMLGACGLANAFSYTFTGTGNSSPGQGLVYLDDVTLYGDKLQPGAPARTDNWYFNITQPLYIKYGQVSFQNVDSFRVQLFSPTSTLLLDSDTCLGCVINKTVSIPYQLLSDGIFLLAITMKAGSIAGSYTAGFQVVPLPAAAWLLLSGVAGLGAMARRRKVAAEA
ncbi:MAG: VPLPA-CTERM sorting domain-containing protein [Steroidobacteraceae bacterium]